MQKTICALIVAVLAFGCSGDGEQTQDTAEHVGQVATEEAAETPAAETEDDAPTEADRLNKEDPVGSYGDELTLTEPVSIAAILQEPEPYEGQVVRVEGTISEVCPRRGCWVNLVDDQTQAEIRVKVADGEIVFPLSAKGHVAVVEGKVEKLELTEEQARSWKEHEAQELGQTFDPASVTGPETVWRIKGQGAEIKG